MAATRKRATKSSASKRRDAKQSTAEPARADGCQQILSDYFDLTGDTLEKQVALCREISTKIVEGKYTAEEAQRDWQDCVDRTAEYSREVTRLWFEGVSRCTASPQLPLMPDFGDLFGRDAAGDRN